MGGGEPPCTSVVLNALIIRTAAVRRLPCVNKQAKKKGDCSPFFLTPVNAGRLLFRFGNHFAAQSAVVVFPQTVGVRVVQIALDIAFVVLRAGVAGERTL